MVLLLAGFVLATGMVSMAFGATPGTLVDAELETEHAPSPVPYSVLLPPGYAPDAGPRQGGYPLLVWLHGGGGDRSFLADQKPLFEEMWRLNRTPPMVVVTPSAGRSFYLDFRDGSQRWETFILDDLIPAMQSRYPIDTERLYIGGISMGGMGSLRMAFKHPQRFRAVIALEPGIEPALAWQDVELRDRYWRSTALLQERYGKPIDEDYWAANHPTTIAHRNPTRLIDAGLAIYIEVGSEDAFGLDRGTDYLHRVLYDAGVPHEYRYVLGAEHVGRTVPPRILDALAFLQRVEAPSVRDPQVERVRRMLSGLKRRAGVEE